MHKNHTKYFRFVHQNHETISQVKRMKIGKLRAKKWKFVSKQWGSMKKNMGFNEKESEFEEKKAVGMVWMK